MSHYLAELIARAKGSSGAERALAERECVDVILKIWKHRAALPGRPLQSFAPIVRMLEILSDKNLNWYFDRTPEADGDVGTWLKIATNIDSASRSLIRWCLAMATTSAARKENKWLKNKEAMALDPTDDIKSAKKIVEDSEHLIERRRAELKRLAESLNYLQKNGRVLSRHFEQLSRALPSPKKATSKKEQGNT
ncbi:MAG: hypothetical protein HY921_03305 [Elusimicrobia bacterium]|nr:hypothetical protein [Elusimicrobiota bacterium]